MQFIMYLIVRASPLAPANGLRMAIFKGSIIKTTKNFKMVIEDR